MTDHDASNDQESNFIVSAIEGGGGGLPGLNGMTYPDLVARKDAIEARLLSINVATALGFSGTVSSPSGTPATATSPGAASKSTKRPKSPKLSNATSLARRKTRQPKAMAGTTFSSIDMESHSQSLLVPVTEKTDTHWDFCMKEMMWLAADFQSERKRQTSSARKLSLAIRQYFKTKESKKARELVDAEIRRRRLAAKISRELRNGFWTKIDRIVAYKQKLQADEGRKKAMNQQLVTLVQRTEKYGESMSRDDFNNFDENDYDDDDNHSDYEDLSGDENIPTDEKHDRKIRSAHQKRNKSLRRRSHYNRLTIEEALAAVNASTATRRSKTRIKDYSKLQVDDTEFYGEATTSEGSGSDDESYKPNDEDEENWIDDETTLREAEVLELQDRRRRRREQSMVDEGSLEDDASFMADPEELRKLQEESKMDIEDVLIILQQESEALSENEGMVDHTCDEMGEDIPVTRKRVHFKTQNTSDTPIPEASLNNDDGIASRDGPAFSEGETPRVGFDEDNDDSDDEEEFAPVAGTDVDDETTIEAEERLGSEMSAEEEISLLQQEGEIPIEELRAMYAKALVGEQDDSGGDHQNYNDDGEEDSSNEATLGMMLNGDNDSNEAYEPDELAAIDDETTIEAEERLGRDMSYAEELDLLKRESEIPVEDILKLYSRIDDEIECSEEDLPLPTLSALTTVLHDDESHIDDEFVPDDDVLDDETTMEAEEKLGREITVEEEIALLQRESEMPIDELLDQYPVAATDEEESSSSDRDSKRKYTSSTDRESKRLRTDDSQDVTDVGLTAISTLEASAERAKQTTASRPYLLAPWVKLREYQKIGLNWLVSLQTRRLNGILADEMGLGKTLQTITLLAYLAAYKGIWGPHLVIVPTSVIVNWETEMKRFCPAFKVLCYYGSAKRRKELRSGWTKTNWYHVVVTSYQLAVQDSFAFRRKKWYYLILDEAQNIKNFQSQRWQTLINFNTQRRLLLTGTPLQNNLMELWSLLHFLMPYIFRSRKEFSYWFSNPMNNIIEGNSARNDDLINRLHGIIRPFVLRRLKKDVETQMPGKYEHIIKCQLSKRQMFLYEEFMARSSTRRSLSKGGNFMAMMNVLMQLRKVCNSPELFEPRSVQTPLVLSEGLEIAVPELVARERLSYDPLSTVSQYLMMPLWVGSSSEPSLAACFDYSDAVRDALLIAGTFPPLPRDVQEPEAEESFNLGLSELLKSVRADIKSSNEATWQLQRDINSRRCRSEAFPYTSALIDHVTLIDLPFDREKAEEVSGGRIFSSPLELLAMRKSHQERAEEMDELMKKFIFCVPKASAPFPKLLAPSFLSEVTKTVVRANEILRQPVEEYSQPFRKACSRLASYFPDKKLIQFDAGKLQALSELLHDLKRGGHRALIFTQMSKMLDVLEAFLNLNGHTYLRLDGSTGVDRRQRLMDRFNNDPKVFCFILSTRSGGLGINLTGADTVIFYDSDWNPAMDAQAQDRAHRIGQTREVHIYRLITEHTIEENILIKAQQKRNLDILVMDRGKFDASQSFAATDRPRIDEVGDVFTKGGLRAILGFDEDTDEMERHPDDINEKETFAHLSKEQMEIAMASLEDEDDVRALRGAQKEAAEELEEFDESIEIKKDSDPDDDEESDEHAAKENATDPQLTKELPVTSESGALDQINLQEDQRNEEIAMEEEFAAWQSKVGLDASAIEASLGAVERYGLHFREEIDPFYSIFAIMEYKRKMEATEFGEEVNIDEIEREKAVEERRAIEEGDLLVTRPRPEDLLRQRNLYDRERARVKATKKRRKLTGENWSSRIDAATTLPYWYNSDTGEASWDKPLVLLENEANEAALRNRWIAMPLKALVNVMCFLTPMPDRINCSYVCRQWQLAATDVSFVRHVYPVEIGALLQSGKKFEFNHYRTITEALAVALPGDTIELGDGHYWIEEPDISINFPLKFVGDENDPSHVVIELSGTISWHARGGWMEGITFRRPKISSVLVSREMLSIDGGCRFDMIDCVFDNGGSDGSVISVSDEGSRGRWENVVVKSGTNGILLDNHASLELFKCYISMNQINGLVCRNASNLTLRSCRVEENGDKGVLLQTSSHADVSYCQFYFNGQSFDREAGCTVILSDTTIDDGMVLST